MLFTESQLDLLIEVQEQNDWHRDYFLDALRTQAPVAQTNISQDEFSALMTKLSPLSPEKIADLQLALDLLGTL